MTCWCVWSLRQGAGWIHLTAGGQTVVIYSQCSSAHLSLRRKMSPEQLVQVNAYWSCTFIFFLPKQPGSKRCFDYGILCICYRQEKRQPDINQSVLLDRTLSSQKAELSLDEANLKTSRFFEWSCSSSGRTLCNACGETALGWITPLCWHCKTLSTHFVWGLWCEFITPKKFAPGISHVRIWMTCRLSGTLFPLTLKLSL